MDKSLYHWWRQSKVAKHIISAVLTPNNVTRLTWQSCAWGIVTRLTDATKQSSLTQPATQSHRAVTLWAYEHCSKNNASAQTPHCTPHTHTNRTHTLVNHKPLVVVHASSTSRNYRRGQFTPGAIFSVTGLFMNLYWQFDWVVLMMLKRGPLVHTNAITAQTKCSTYWRTQLKAAKRLNSKWSAGQCEPHRFKQTPARTYTSI